MRYIHRPAPHPLLSDYSEAVARAIAWLGDRYLLARPINASGARGYGAPGREEGTGAEPSAPKRELAAG